MSNTQPLAPTIPWDSDVEVVALHHFNGNSHEDLSFKKNDIMKIIRSTRDPMWYFARHSHTKQEGMIPANYVQKREAVKLQSMPWFHGKLTREKAEEVLQPPTDGLYLIRESNNYPGDYTLCVCCDKKVEHYHIISNNKQLTIDEETYFEDLIQLVEHYMKDADGLCVNLKKPVNKVGGSINYSVTPQAFIDGAWVIKLSDLKIGDSIGKGEFGDVKRGEYKGEQVAVKELKNRSAATQFLTEASIMTSLNHINLVQLLGIVIGDTIRIVTEFMGKGSLVEYLRSRGRTVITKEDQINFASDTAAGMAYLESKHVVHRDLAARNVLIQESPTIAKVSDFGLARTSENSISNENASGKIPIKWTAPEAIKSNVYTSKSDMWSFGILLWEIYSFGRVPYPRIPLSDVRIHVERGYRMEAPDGCPDNIYSIMTRSWEIKPEKRPSFKEIAAELKNLKS